VRCCTAFLPPSSPAYVRSSSAWGEKKGRQKEDHRTLTDPAHPGAEGGLCFGENTVSYPHPIRVKTQRLPSCQTQSPSRARLAHQPALLLCAEPGMRPGWEPRQILGSGVQIVEFKPWSFFPLCLAAFPKLPSSGQ
jgi:hypothetical protein